MDATQKTLSNVTDSYLYYQPNLRDPSFQPDPTDHFGSVGIQADYYSQDVRGPPVAGAQYFPTAPILCPVTHAEGWRLPPDVYTRTTSGHLSVVPDHPAWPTLRGPIDFPHNNTPLWVPALEYRPTESRGLYINHLDPFSVESSWPAVGSSMYSGSGCLSNAPVSGRPCAFNEANHRGRSENVWGPVVRPSVGQVASGHPDPSGATGAQVETHVPGRGIYGMCCIGKTGEEVTFGNEGRNRVNTVIITSDWRDQGLEATCSLDRIGHTSTGCAPIEAGVSTLHDNRGVYHTTASLPGPSAHTFTFPIPVSPRAVGAIHTTRPKHRAGHRYEGPMFDRPGKKVAAEYEPDPDSL